MSAPHPSTSSVFGALVDVINRSNTATPEDRAALVSACESVLRAHLAAIGDVERCARESVTFREAFGIVAAEVLFRVLHGPRFAFEAMRSRVWARTATAEDKS